MNPLLALLAEGDLRSDGLSSEVVRFVLANPELLVEVIEGLSAGDDVVRGRAADAIEHIAREIPEQLTPYQAQIEHSLRYDAVPMVRWHMAMVLGHMALDWQDPEQACLELIANLRDMSVFVVSWSIVSLCIYARLYPDQNEIILQKIAPLTKSDSTALRSKVRSAVQILQHPEKPLPKGWVKCEKILAQLIPGKPPTTD